MDKLDARNAERDILRAKAGLQTTVCALIDDYPMARRQGRTDAWLKAVIAVAEWYAYIDEHGTSGADLVPPPITTEEKP